MDSPTLELQLVQGKQGLSGIKSDWLALHLSVSSKSFCQSPFWFESYLEHLADGQESWFFAAIYQDKSLVAVVPLVEKQQKFLIFQFKVLGLSLHGHFGLRNCLIADNISRQAVAELCYQQLNQTKNIQWDLLSFEAVLETSEYSKLAESLTHVTIIKRPAVACDIILVAKDGHCLDTLSKNFRRNFTKAKNKLAKVGAVDFVSAQTGDNLWHYFDEFLQVEASGWKGASGSGSAIVLHENLRAFYRQVMEDFSQYGQVEINLMRVDEKPIAGQLSFLMGDTVYLFKIGYNEAYAKCQPGHLLIEHMLAEYQQRKSITEVNLISDAQWHHSWQPKIIEGWNYFICRSSFKGRFFAFLGKLKSLLA